MLTKILPGSLITFNEKIYPPCSLIQKSVQDFQKNPSILIYAGRLIYEFIRDFRVSVLCEVSYGYARRPKGINHRSNKQTKTLNFFVKADGLGIKQKTSIQNFFYM